MTQIIRDRKIKFALIGCGRISARHFEAVYGDEAGNIPPNADAEFVDVCDIDEKALETACKKHNIRGHRDYREMLAKTEADVIAICTPNGLHYEMGMAAVEARKHVLMEKPFCADLMDADNLIAAARDNRLHTFAVLQVRYNNTIQLLKKLLHDRKLGKLYSAAVCVRWLRPQKYFVGWRGTKALDCGTVLNQGIHYIDILQWLLGPVKRVMAQSATIAHTIELEDQISALIEFKSGVQATFEFSVNTFPKNKECSLYISGEKGSVEISGDAMNKIEYFEVDGIERPDISVRDGNTYAGGLYKGSCPNHPFIYNDVIRVLKTGDVNYINGDQARKSLELVLTMYKSASEKKFIEFI
ncbi:MAG TPA: oxidoreductase [Candidatus Wallbacteria bacterium]|nr:oxidoreductase [Candidatus Wallbacteria bacterium]